MFQNDETRWPLIVTKWTPPHTSEDMAAYLAWQLKTVEAARRRGARLVFVHDAGADSPPLDVATRKVVSDWRRAHRDVGEVMVGNWVVAPSRLTRGVLTALAWSIREARDVRSAATLEDAIAGGRAQLANLGSVR